jgi:hypothetical protein
MNPGLLPIPSLDDVEQCPPDRDDAPERGEDPTSRKRHRTKTCGKKLTPRIESDARGKGAKESKEEEEEILSCGFIVKAPLPVEQALQFETSNNIGEGAYFKALMRKRFQCICDVQTRWLSRACNRKHPAYVETQATLKEFAETIVIMFDVQFGTNPNTADMITTRKHAHTKKRPHDKKMQDK